MKVEQEQGAAILARTPGALDVLLGGLPAVWLEADEGPGTWSPFDIVGHLIHGERTDWIPRAKMILEQGESATFEPFDRFAQFEASQGKTMEELLHTFALLRKENLETLRSLSLSEADLERRGLHPDFGPVTLGQLLSSWVVHDLGHIAQIARAMAGRYRDEAGPWRKYLPILGLER